MKRIIQYLHIGRHRSNTTYGSLISIDLDATEQNRMKRIALLFFLTRHSKSKELIVCNLSANLGASYNFQSDFIAQAH